MADKFTSIMEGLKNSRTKIQVTLTNKNSFNGVVEDYDNDFLVFKALNAGGRQIFFRNGISMISIPEESK